MKLSNVLYIRKTPEGLEDKVQGKLLVRAGMIKKSSREFI